MRYGFVYCNNKRIIIIKLSFNENEQNKKMTLRIYINKFNKNKDSFVYYFLKPFDYFEGKYNKEKLNNIIEYEKDDKKINLLCFKHYSTNTDFYYYNVCFSLFLIDLKCKTYKRRGIVSLDHIILKKNINLLFLVCFIIQCI